MTRACFVCGGTLGDSHAARVIFPLGLVEVCSQQCADDPKFSLPAAPPGPGEWQARMAERLVALGYDGFIFGPGVNWWPMTAGEKVAGPFRSPAEFDAWLDASEKNS